MAEILGPDPLEETKNTHCAGEKANKATSKHVDNPDHYKRGH